MSGARPTIPGVTLDREVVESADGEGAVEYAGRQSYVDRPVVVRVSKERPRDAAAIDRFRRDAARLVAAAHPGIVACLDAGVTADGYPYLVLERIDGPSLAAWRAEGRRLAPPQALALVRELALALRHAQAHGLAHGAVDARHVRLDARGGGGRPYAPKLDGFAVARGEPSTPLVHAQDVLELTRLARELGATSEDGAAPSGLSWDDWIASCEAKLQTRRPRTSAAVAIAMVLLAATIWGARELQSRYAPRGPPLPTGPGRAAPGSAPAPSETPATAPSAAGAAIQVQRERAAEPFAPVRAGERVALEAAAAAPSANVRWQLLEPEGLVTVAAKPDALEFVAPFGLRQRRVRVRAVADRAPPLEGTFEITASEPPHAALPDADAVALAGLGPDWYAGGDDPAARQSFGDEPSVAAWSLPDEGATPFALELRLHREDATSEVASGARVEFGDATALELRLAVEKDADGGEVRRAQLLATRTRAPDLEAASEPWPGAAARFIEIELPRPSERGLAAPDVLPPPLCARLRVAWDPEADAFEVELAPELARWDAAARRWTTSVGPATRQRIVWHEVTGRRLWLPTRLALFRPARAGLCVHGVRRAN